MMSLQVVHHQVCPRSKSGWKIKSDDGECRFEKPPVRTISGNKSDEESEDEEKDSDRVEAMQTWELEKKIGLYVDDEEGLIQTLAKMKNQREKKKKKLRRKRRGKPEENKRRRIKVKY